MAPLASGASGSLWACPLKYDVVAMIFEAHAKVATQSRGTDRPSHDVPLLWHQRLLVLSAARALAGLERGGDRRAGPAGPGRVRGAERAALNQ